MRPTIPSPTIFLRNITLSYNHTRFPSSYHLSPPSFSLDLSPIFLSNPSSSCFLFYVKHFYLYLSLFISCNFFPLSFFQYSSSLSFSHVNMSPYLYLLPLSLM